MDIEPKHLDGKPKKIGQLNGKPVFHMRTKGGLHMVATYGSGGLNIIGSAPHRAIATHIAQKKEPDVEWSELSKGEYVDPSTFEHLVPEYEALTDTMVELSKKK